MRECEFNLIIYRLFCFVVLLILFGFFSGGFVWIMCGFFFCARICVCVCMCVCVGGGGVNNDNKFKSSRTFHKFQTFSLMYYNIFLVSSYNSLSPMLSLPMLLGYGLISWITCGQLTCILRAIRYVSVNPFRVFSCFIYDFVCHWIDTTCLLVVYGICRHTL